MKSIVFTVLAAFLVLTMEGQARYSPGLDGTLKSASVTKQKLDSVYISSWDSAGATWKLGSKTDYAYDMNGNMILSFGYGWISSSGQWKARTKFECNYDFLGLLSYTVSFTPDTIPGAWRPIIKHEYTFDPNKNIAEDIQLNWSSDSSRLIYSSKIDNTYDLAGRLTAMLMSVVNSRSQWQPLTQSNYTYDSSGYLSVETALDMNLVNHLWYPAFRNDHSYDSAGNLIRTIYSLPDTGAVSWKYTSKNEYAYNNMSKMILETDYLFSETDSVWTRQTKEERTYTGNGDMWIKYDYTWDQEVSQWVPVSVGKIVCDYNIAFPLSQLILPAGFENYNSDHLMMDKFQYRWNGSQWDQFVQNQFYYSEKNLGVRENSLDYCRVFPNPARDHLSIDWPGLKGDMQVSIYNMDGALVFSGIVPVQATINCGNLPAGEYILKITGDRKITSTKLILQ
jgi:hypothetical protein